MTLVYCRSCNDEITNTDRAIYRATEPAGYECLACWRNRHPVNEPDDEPDDQDATPLVEGDDPDDSIDWGNVREVK